jgi:hypothetical protein
MFKSTYEINFLIHIQTSMQTNGLTLLRFQVFIEINILLLKLKIKQSVVFPLNSVKMCIGIQQNWVIG